MAPTALVVRRRQRLSSKLGILLGEERGEVDHG